MTPTDRACLPRRSYEGAFAGAIIALALVAAAGAGWDNSATNDEPYHTLAAFTYVHDGHADLNPEHPPLSKLFSGAALLPLGLRPVAAPPVERLHALLEEVHRFLYGNTVSAATILRAARLPQLLFLLILLIGVFEWASWAFDDRSALLATLAVACQPLVLGHSFVVHTDVAAAAGWTWTLYLLHRWLAGRTSGWLGFGVALGLTLLAKFSAVYLVPIAAVAVLVAVARSRRHRELVRFAGACAVALAIAVAGMAIPLRHSTLAEERATISTVLGLWPRTAGLSQHLQAVAGISRPLAHYGLGLAYVHETDLHGQGINVLFGTTSSRGFWLYFPAALALKTSLPFLLLAGAGLVGAARTRARTELAMLAVVATYFAISLGTSYNIGARHLMPVIPLLAMVGAHHAVRWNRWAVRILAVGLVASPVIVFPHYIAHFSMLVGGSRNGARFLNDSNLDWGQDWTRLAREAAARGWHPMAYAYIGAGDPGAEMPGAVDALASRALPPGSYLAVSSFAEAVGVPYLRAFGYRDDAARLAALLEVTRTKGTAVGGVGDTITVYAMPGTRVVPIAHSFGAGAGVAGTATVGVATCSPLARRLRTYQVASFESCTPRTTFSRSRTRPGSLISRAALP